MKKISRKELNELTHICREYDPFTQYIENYTQMERKQENNRCLDKWFMEVMLNLGVDVRGIPFSLKNKGSDTQDAVIKWLSENGIGVEEDNKRVWTEEEIRYLIQTNDKVLYGALKKLYEKQTEDEQQLGETTHTNGVGFNGVDSRFLSSVAEFLIKNGFLTIKQKSAVRKRLIKYNKQLTRIANA